MKQKNTKRKNSEVKGENVRKMRKSNEHKLWKREKMKQEAHIDFTISH